MIELSDVTVRFGRTRALDAVDLTFDTGLTGLFGQNASGKSTLLRVIAGLQRPSSGRVTFEGVPITIADEGWRRLVGYAGHNSGLYRQLTLAENLALFARLYDSPRDNVDRVITAVGLEEFATTPAGDLSAGTLRRGAVARALVHEPQILLLDEPYANLDDDATGLVTGAIQSWFGRGRLAIVASHGAKRVRVYATTGVILQRGRVSNVSNYAVERVPR